MRTSVKRYWGDFPDWLYWKAQLFQESRFDPDARSPVGAQGLAQFMPGTWDQVMRQMALRNISPRDAKYAIDAGAFYMANLRHGWSSPRPTLDRHKLAEASYNAGTGNLVKAQRLCDGKPLYTEIAPCLPSVTGPAAQETLTYVTRIEGWRAQLAVIDH